MKILISADSTCDLSKALLEKYDIALTPLTVQIAGDSYHDGVDVTAQDIFTASESGKKVASAAVNTYEYTDFFRERLTRADAVIHITIGSDFSACYQNACLAAQQMKGVYIVDSENLTTGSGVLVVEAAKMAEAGRSVPEILAALEALKPKIDASFVIEGIDYLRRGGRCSSVAALGAKMLSIKPSVEVIYGKMTVGRKYRGTLPMCLKHYITDRLAAAEDIDPDYVFLTHSPCGDGIVEAVRAQLEETGLFEQIFETDAGCTVCTHCGPNTLGIIYKRKSAKRTE